MASDVRPAAQSVVDPSKFDRSFSVIGDELVTAEQSFVKTGMFKRGSTLAWIVPDDKGQDVTVRDLATGQVRVIKAKLVIETDDLYVGKGKDKKFVQPVGVASVARPVLSVDSDWCRKARAINRCLQMHGRVVRTLDPTLSINMQKVNERIIDSFKHHELDTGVQFLGMQLKGPKKKEVLLQLRVVLDMPVGKFSDDEVSEAAAKTLAEQAPGHERVREAMSIGLIQRDRGMSVADKEKIMRTGLRGFDQGVGVRVEEVALAATDRLASKMVELVDMSLLPALPRQASAAAEVQDSEPAPAVAARPPLPAMPLGAQLMLLGRSFEAYNAEASAENYATFDAAMTSSAEKVQANLDGGTLTKAEIAQFKGLLGQMKQAFAASQDAASEAWVDGYIAYAEQCEPFAK